MSGLEIPLLIGGTALSAGSKLMQAGQQSAAAEFESQQYAQQAQAQKTAGMQEEASRRRELDSNLQAIQAIRAGRGVGASSPTAMAIYDNGIGLAEDDILAARANSAVKADLAQRASSLSARKSQTSMLAGFLGAGSDIFSAGYKLKGKA